MKPVAYRLPLLVGASSLLAACMTTPPGGTGGTPAPAASTPAGAASAGPAAPGATATPGIHFRDDFDGDRLDPTRWKAFDQGGRVVVRDGRLELLVTGSSATTPVVVPVADNLPKDGPSFVEVGYEILAQGAAWGLNLDFLPPEVEGDPGLTEPFAKVSSYSVQLQYTFKTESASYGVLVPGYSLTPKQPRRFRLEFDGTDTYRFIHDQFDLKTFKSVRRPTRLWFGAAPNKPVPPKAFMSLSYDYVVSGVLVEPDPAKPQPTPTPRATVAPPAPAEPAAP